MTLDQLTAFVLFAIAAAGTPGPSNVMITATGAAVGFVRGFPCALGASAGMGLLLAASALGLGQIVLAVPALTTVLKIAGAGFLFWLAWKIATAGGATGDSEGEATGFLGAMVFQWMNPKGWLVAVSAAGSFLPSAVEAPLLQSFLIGGLFFAAALPCGLLWLGVGATLRTALKHRRTARVFNLAMALALAGSVLFLLR